MAEDEPDQPKLCVRCGHDCSGRARFRTARGRYLCARCLDQLRQAHRAGRGGESGPAGSPSTTAPIATPAAAPTEAARDDDDALATLDDLDESDATIPLEAPDEGPGTVPCPVCLAPMLADHNVCGRCGFDRRAGAQSSTLVEQTSGARRRRRSRARSGYQCRQCGYDLVGAPGARCPECGTLILKQSRREQDRQAARGVQTAAWLVPTVILAAGLTVNLALGAWTGGIDSLGPQITVLGSQLVGAISLYLLCCFAWLGFDTTLPLTALRVAAACSVALAIISLVGCALLVSLGVFVVVYAGMLYELFDIELQEGIIIAALTFIVCIMGVPFILSVLM